MAAATAKKRAAKAKELEDLLQSGSLEQVTERLQHLDEDPTDPEHEAELQSLRQRREVLEVQAIERSDMATRTPTDTRPVPVSAITTTGNHRESDDLAEIERLARSISSIGLQQPIGVRQITRDKDISYELIYGSRRLRACQSLSWKLIQAVVYPEDTSPEEVELRRTAENFARREITPSEQALAVARMLEAVRGSTDRQLMEVVRAGGVEKYVGQLLGRPERWVRDHAYVTRLGGVAREMLRSGRITLGHARELAKLGDPEEADAGAGMAARNDYGNGGMLGGWSVERLRAWVEEKLASLSRAQWSLDAEFLQLAKDKLPANACNACTYNSAVNPGLFGLVEADAKGRCSHGQCFRARTEIAEKEIVAGLKKLESAKVKAEKKGEKLVLSDFVPVTVKASTFTRKAKAVVSGEMNAEVAAAPAQRRGSESAESPEQKAERLYRHKVGDWKRKVEDSIVKHLRGYPGGVTLFQNLEPTLIKQFSVETYGPPGRIAKSREKVLKAVEQRQHFNAIRAVLSATLEQVHEAEKRRYMHLNFWDVHELAIQMIADALNLKVPAMPQPPEASGNAAGNSEEKKPTRSRKRKEASPAVDDQDADEVDPEE